MSWQPERKMTTFGDLSGRHLLVTGASSGLGAHFGRMLAASGAVVTLAARREEILRELAGEIGAPCRYVMMDVTDPASVEAAFMRAEELSGPIAGVVNNAGVAGTGAALELAASEWDRIVDTDLKGVWLVAQAAARAMVRQRQRQCLMVEWRWRRRRRARTQRAKATTTSCASSCSSKRDPAVYRPRLSRARHPHMASIP